MIAGVETGGTKVVLGLAEAHAPEDPVEVVRVPTRDPARTLADIRAFLEDAAATRGLDAVGLASFGPVNVDPARPRYGWITGTSKPGWADTALLDGVEPTPPVPITLMSDVSGAALGEQRFGAGRGVTRVAYATVGTGVGVGLVEDGRVRHGNGYPEIGHLLVRRHPDDPFPGACPFHGDCAEGLVAGPAVLARWGADASHLPPAVRPGALAILGFYVAQVVAAVALVEGVERVVLGGGVMQAPGLIDAARAQLPAVLGGAEAGHAVPSAADLFLVPPALGDRSGLLGALAAAAHLLHGGRRPAPLAGAAPSA